MGKVVVLCGSPRKNGNSSALARAFAEGASLHNETEILYLTDYHIGPCLGCNHCMEKNQCVQQDDMHILYGKLADADVIAAASPVYFYGVSAQLKTVIDRLHNPLRDQFKVKRTVLLLTGAASLPALFDGILVQYHLILNFFKLEDAGSILVRRMKNAGDIEGTPELERARALGASL